MSRTCCHHYPGGIVRCVSRSLPSRRRPSPLVWRVGSHDDGFGACSVFTRVTARAVRWPPEEVVSRSASGHSSPPDPPRVLPAGARVRRPGFSPGRTVRLGKAHIPIWSKEAFARLHLIARTRSSPATIRGRRTGPALASTRKPTSPTCLPSSSISGPPRVSTNSCPGPGRPSTPRIASRRDGRRRSTKKSSHQIRAIKRPLTANLYMRRLCWLEEAQA